MELRITFILALTLVLMIICSANASVKIKIKQPKNRRRTSNSKKKSANGKEITEAVEEAVVMESKVRDIEEKLIERKITLAPKNPAFFVGVFKKPTESSIRNSNCAQVLLQATKVISRRRRIPVDTRVRNFTQLELINTDFNDMCFPSLECNSTKYRTYDGRCNNLNNPLWGKAEISFVRLAEPDYQDGVEAPRVAHDNSRLPSARTVSLKATASRDNENPRYTHMVMQWGQFVDHDITLTPITTVGQYGSTINITCCEKEGTVDRLSSNILHPSCFPIWVAANDPFYQRHKIRCMDFVRSAAGLRRDCTFGPREQQNIITAYIDGSNVYGSNSATADILRTKKNGLLRFHKEGSSNLLPGLPGTEECPASPKPCFRAGDTRANEQPNLAIMHTLWMREHNRIARKLGKINSNWNDEKLFQETRRIVVAEMQHITYNEWIPIILGNAFSVQNELVPKDKGYSKSYDSSVDASIANSFATAAYRFGHSLIQGRLSAFDENGRQTGSKPINKLFFSPSFLYEPGTIDEMIRGLTTQASQDFDNNFPTQITNKLFARTKPFGVDLVALNVQRGRDHGLPSFLTYREACGFDAVNSFDDLEADLGCENVRKLRRVYKSVKDIDLFIGGIMEKKIEGALVGKTFRCIIGNQFERLKIGDRFYYENGESKKTRFSRAQLNEIRKTSLSRIICDNAENIKSMQPWAFYKEMYWNKKVSCKNRGQIKSLNLRKWKNSSRAGRFRSFKRNH